MPIWFGSLSNIAQKRDRPFRTRMIGQPCLPCASARFYSGHVPTLFTLVCRISTLLGTYIEQTIASAR
jgi:hypothetical protein